MFVYRIYALYFVFQSLALVSTANIERSELNRMNKSSNQRQPFITSTLQSMKRALTTSQVLTFNLTNALILLIMKGILIIAGILGKISFWKYPNLGGIPIVRSINSSDTASQIYNSLFSDEDIRWSSTYFWAINKDDFGCLYRLACENRKSAQIYLNGGQIFSRAAKSVFSILKLSYNQRYDDILIGLQEALDTQENCRTRYSCRAPFDKLKFISFLQNFG